MMTRTRPDMRITLAAVLSLVMSALPSSTAKAHGGGGGGGHGGGGGGHMGGGGGAHMGGGGGAHMGGGYGMGGYGGGYNHVGYGNGRYGGYGGYGYGGLGYGGLGGFGLLGLGYGGLGYGGLGYGGYGGGYGNGFGYGGYGGGYGNGFGYGGYPGYGFNSPQGVIQAAPLTYSSAYQPAGASMMIPSAPVAPGYPVETLGISEETTTDALGRGVKVTQVNPGSPAERAGLKVGDVITRSNGYLVEGAGNLRWVISHAANGTLALNVHSPGEAADRPVDVPLP